jgi:hypothetical protein
MTTTLKILLIEDSVPLARSYEALLTAAGHQVHWYIGARSLEPLVLIAPDKTDAPINASDYDFAFCDGQLEGKLEGSAIVKELKKGNVVCAGISTIGKMNDEMVANGARVGFNKAVGLYGVLSNMVCPVQIMNADNETLSNLPASVEATMKNDESNRKACDKLIMGFMHD